MPKLEGISRLVPPSGAEVRAQSSRAPFHQVVVVVVVVVTVVVAVMVVEEITV